MISSNQRRRVVVTGVGVINPLGNDIETVWSALKEGKSGVDYTTIFDASKFPTRISAEVKNWDIAIPGGWACTWVRAKAIRISCRLPR